MASAAKGLNTPKTARPVLILLLVALGFLLFYAAINTTSLWDNDEPTYAEIAKEMVKSGNWLTPTFNYESWFCHPPLYMWLTATAFRTFGWNELTSRLFPSLFAILGMLMVFKFASTWWNEKIGFLAAIVLGTSLQYLIQGGMATMDTMLNTFLLIAFYSAWRGFHEQGKTWWFVFFISCGLATLAKGVFGLAYPLFIYGLYFAFTRQNYRWREVPWVGGLCLYLAVAAPWFLYETWKNGHPFLYQVFYFYTFKRLITPILDQSGPWYYYFPVLLFGFFPWSGFLPVLSIKSWQERKNDKIAFLSLWTASTFLFFTLVHTKLPNYIFFVYPPLALLLAYFWESLNKKQMVLGMILTLFSLGALAAGLKLFAVQKLLPEELDGNLRRLWPIMGILPLGVLFALLVKLILHRNRFVFAALVVTMSLFWLILHYKFSDIVESYKPMKPLAQELQGYRTLFPAPVLAYHVPGTASLIFYTDTSIVNVNDRNDFLKLWKTEKLYCFIADSTLTTLKESMKPYWALNRKRTIWLVSNFDPSVLRQRSH